MVVLSHDKVIIMNRINERKLKNKARNKMKERVNENEQYKNKVIKLKNICINQ